MFVINKLSINERRLLYFLKSKVKPEDYNIHSYRFNIKELALALGINKRPIDVEILNIITRLQHNPVIIETKTTILQANWIVSACFTKDEVELETSPKAKAILLSNNFCGIQIKHNYYSSNL